MTGFAYWGVVPCKRGYFTEIIITWLPKQHLEIVLFSSQKKNPLFPAHPGDLSKILKLILSGVFSKSLCVTVQLFRCFFSCNCTWVQSQCRSGGLIASDWRLIPIARSSLQQGLELSSLTCLTPHLALCLVLIYLPSHPISVQAQLITHNSLCTHPQQREWIAPPAVEFQGHVCLLYTGTQLRHSAKISSWVPGTMLLSIHQAGEKDASPKREYQEHFCATGRMTRRVLGESFCKAEHGFWNTSHHSCVNSVVSVLFALPYLSFLGQQWIESAQRLTHAFGMTRFISDSSHQINKFLPPPAHYCGYERANSILEQSMWGWE